MISAWDLDLAGSVVSGTGSVNIHGSKFDQTIGLGTAVQQMHIDDNEIERISAIGGLMVGSSHSGSIAINTTMGFTSYNIIYTLSLIASGDDDTVTLTGIGSTFNSLSMQADNGVFVSSDVTTLISGLYLDGDFDRSNYRDTFNSITLSADRTLTSKTQMTLESATGEIFQDGPLTLLSGHGILLLGSLTATASHQPLTIDANLDLSQDGTLTVATGKTVTTNNSSVWITAWDLDLDGSLDAGTARIDIRAAKALETIGLGNSVKDMQIDDLEFSRMTSINGLEIGDSGNASITVNGMRNWSPSRCNHLLSTRELLCELWGALFYLKVLLLKELTQI